MPLSFDRKLEKTITLKTYSTFNNAISGGAEFGEVKVKGGARLPGFFSIPVYEKLPDVVKPGDQLLGPVGFGEPAFPAASKKCRGGYTVHYAVTVPKAEEKKDDVQDDDIRTNEEKLGDAMRDAQIEHLKTLRKWATREEHRVLLNRLLSEYPKHLPVYLERIVALEEIKNPDPPKDKEAEPKAGRWETDWTSVVTAVDDMLDQIDLRDLAAHLGRRVDKDDKRAMQVSKDKDKIKDAVIQGLTKKITTLGKTGGKQQITSAFKELSCWVDTADAKQARAVFLYERALGNLGLALAAINKEIGEEKAAKRELLEERADLIEQLGWLSWANQERQCLSIKFPKMYSRF